MLRFYTHHLGEYMRRWILVHPWGTVRLHHIREPDGDPDLHTHPFDFVSVILRGGYLEELPPECERDRGNRYVWHLAPAINRSVGAARHRIDRVTAGGAWTLVFTSRRLRPWGFEVDGRFVHWRDYVSSKIDLDEYEAKLNQNYNARPSK